MTHYARLSCTAAHSLIAERQAAVIDIRDAASFASGHMHGAVHVDNTTMQDFIDDADMDHPLIVCCYHGNMSQAAGQFLVERGFDEVYSLDGGFAEWSERYPASVSSDAAAG